MNDDITTSEIDGLSSQPEQLNPTEVIEERGKRSRKKAAAPNNEDKSVKQIDSNILKELIREALMAQSEKTKAKFYKEECAKAVINTLSEFLQTYALIGYDFEGTPIRIVNAHNGLEADAIGSALQKFMLNLHSGSFGNE